MASPTRCGWRRNESARVHYPTMNWNRKDLLGLRELSADEINFILETADAFKQVGTREIKKVPALRGKTLVNFFVEPSTRTRTSFELAAFRLSADVINISATTSSLTKGETLKVTGSNQIDKVLPDADMVTLRRSQHDRQRKEYFTGISEYTTLFGLTKERAKRLKPDCLVMHPGPINRGVEIDSEVADGLQSVILEQVTNGLAVRMAVLYLCGGIAT